jgi:hypothetical protein
MGAHPAFPAHWGNAIDVDVRNALTAIVACERFGVFNRLRFCAALSLIPTNQAPVSAQYIAGKSFPCMTNSTSPKKLGLRIRVIR